MQKSSPEQLAPRYKTLQLAFKYARWRGFGEDIDRWHFFAGAAAMFDMLTSGDAAERRAAEQEVYSYLAQAKERLGRLSPPR